MINSIKRLLGIETIDMSELAKNGATIIDVRSKGEFQRGHIKGAKNIPVDAIQSKLKTLKKDDTIICYCQSGARSGIARRILKSKGYTHVYNGGSYMRLQNRLRS